MFNAQCLMFSTLASLSLRSGFGEPGARSNVLKSRVFSAILHTKSPGNVKNERFQAESFIFFCPFVKFSLHLHRFHPYVLLNFEYIT